MPFEQSKIAIAPAVIMHPNSKNIPKGPMTSKQVKKAYKERNAGPKMTKAEQRKEEQQIREAQRLELEKEKRLEREKRKREKKREEEAEAMMERRKRGEPEKSRWVRPSQNRITGFIALGKRNRDDSLTDADTTREKSVVGDMRPPKNKRLSLDRQDKDSGCASPDNDIDTAMLDITLLVNEDDISTVASRGNNTERTLPKAASQKKARPQISDDERTLPRAATQGKARPQISDDELEPVTKEFRSSQLAEAPNFGTIGDAEESSFVSTGRFKTPALEKAAPQSPVRMLADPFPASQDYDAQCEDMDTTVMHINTVMADADDVFIPSKARDLPKLPSQNGEKTPLSKSIVRSATYYDLFTRTDSPPQSAQPAQPVQDEIHKTYSPIKSRPSTTANLPKQRNPTSFEADEDYDSYFLTQPSAPSVPKVAGIAKQKTPMKAPKKAAQPKPGPQISDDEVRTANPTAPAAKGALPAKQKTPKKASQSNARPQISDDEIDYDAFFATQIPNALVSPLFSRKEVKETPRKPKAQALVTKKVAGPPKVDPFAASQDYFAMCGGDPFQATQQAPLPKVPDVVRKAVAAKPTTSRRMQSPAKPIARKTPVTIPSAKTTVPRTMQPPAQSHVAKTPNNQPPPSTDYDSYFSPDAPHAKPFQKQTPVVMAAPAKPLPKQFEASQDYFAMCGDDEDYDGDITPVLPIPKVTMSPENLAQHNAYNAKQQAKMKPPARPPQMQKPIQPATAGQRIGKFVLPVTPYQSASTRQALQQIQSAAQNMPRPMPAPKFKPHVPQKQTSTSVQRPPAPGSCPPSQRHSAPPRPAPVLEVGDDFEVVSGTQLMRELSKDPELNANPPQADTGTKHNLSQHLMWLITEGPRPGQQQKQREPLKPREQNVVRPPSFQAALDKNKRASYPPAKPANTSASRFLPQKTSAPAREPAPSKQQAVPKYQKTRPKPASKAAPKPIPSIEADDPIDLDDVDFPSGTQLMREMAEEEEHERRSRSATILPQSKPQVNIRQPTPVYKSFGSDSQLMRDMEVEESQENAKRASETPRPPQQKYTSRDATPVCESFESNSQILRELAEEEDEQTAKKASETPCPPQHTESQMFITAATTTKELLTPLSFHIASHELQTLSQIEREMAEEEAQAANAEPNTIETPAEKISLKPNQTPAQKLNTSISQHSTARNGQVENTTHGISFRKPTTNEKTPATIQQLPQAKFAPTLKEKPHAHPVTQQRWPKMRSLAGDFRPLPADQLTRELAADGAERAKQLAKYRQKTMSGWEGGWWQGPMDQNYDSEELLEMTRLEEKAKHTDGAYARRCIAVEHDLFYGDENIYPPDRPELEKMSEGERRRVNQLVGMSVNGESTPSQVIEEMTEQEEREKKEEKQEWPANWGRAPTSPIRKDLMEDNSWMALSAMKPPRKRGDWLTKTVENRNAVGSAREAPKNAAPKAVAVAPTIENFEPEDDDQIMKELAEEEAASRSATPAPAPAPQAPSSSEVARELLARCRQPSSKQTTPFPTSRSSKGRRAFGGLSAKPAVAVPPPATPRVQSTTDLSPPPSTQQVSRIPSATPLTVKRARKPLFFQEKPEDREESVVFDSKLQAGRDEQKRKEIEEEQKRQDEWLRQLCGTQAAAQMR